MRLILYNIEYLGGTTKSNWQYLDLYHFLRVRKGLDEKIANSLKKLKPDILALVEIDNGSSRYEYKNQIEYFSKILGFTYMAHGLKYLTQGFYKNILKIPILQNQENAILTKYEIEKIKKHYLTKGFKRLVIEATIKIPERVTLLLTHLSLFKKTREYQIKELGKLVKTYKNPVLLVGDFNTFNSEELNYLLDNTQLVDAYQEDCADHQIMYTGPSWKPKYRLDNILVSPQIKIKKYQIADIRYSDHLPVIVDFEIRKK